MKTRSGAAVFLILLLLPGCASKSNPGGLSEREVGGLAGAGMGAGTGAIIGSATGNAAAGTAIGAPVGLVAGALVGEGMRRSKEDAKREIREENMEAESSEPSVIRAQKNSENRAMYNPKTGQTFPIGYMYDPTTGERLEPVKPV